MYRARFLGIIMRRISSTVIGPDGEQALSICGQQDTEETAIVCTSCHAIYPVFKSSDGTLTRIGSPRNCAYTGPEADDSVFVRFTGDILRVVKGVLINGVGASDEQGKCVGVAATGVADLLPERLVGSWVSVRIVVSIEPMLIPSSSAFVDVTPSNCLPLNRYSVPRRRSFSSPAW